MIQKSSASLQGSLFSELKELLALIGDAKKSKEQLELLSEDVVVLKELYQKNQQEVDKLISLNSEIDKKRLEIESSELELKKDKEILDKKRSSLNDKEMAISLLEKKTEIYKNELEKELSSKIIEVESLGLSSAKSKIEAEEKSKKADDLIKEYEEKLSKLKAMVG